MLTKKTGAREGEFSGPGKHGVRRPLPRRGRVLLDNRSLQSVRHYVNHKSAGSGRI